MYKEQLPIMYNKKNTRASIGRGEKAKYTYVNTRK
jgi:hypothetical protein